MQKLQKEIEDIKLRENIKNKFSDEFNKFSKKNEKNSIAFFDCIC